MKTCPFVNIELVLHFRFKSRLFANGLPLSRTVNGSFATVYVVTGLCMSTVIFLLISLISFNYSASYLEPCTTSADFLSCYLMAIGG